MLDTLGPSVFTHSLEDYNIIVKEEREHLCPQSVSVFIYLECPVCSMRGSTVWHKPLPAHS